MAKTLGLVALDPSMAIGTPCAHPISDTAKRLKFRSKPPFKGRTSQNLRPGCARTSPKFGELSTRDTRDGRRAGQWSGAGGGRPDQGNHHPDLREGRYRGIETPAGAGRL